MGAGGSRLREVLIVVSAAMAGALFGLGGAYMNVAWYSLGSWQKTTAYFAFPVMFGLGAAAAVAMRPRRR